MENLSQNNGKREKNVIRNHYLLQNINAAKWSKYPCHPIDKFQQTQFFGIGNLDIF